MESVSFGRGKSVRSYAVDARGRMRVVSIGRRGGSFPFAYREGAKKGEWISILLFLTLRASCIASEEVFLTLKPHQTQHQRLRRDVA